MRPYISDAVREAVRQRARKRCEYCLRPENISQITYHIDHIISEKHGGSSALENLAYCCPWCNLYKGSDISSVLEGSKERIPLYDPRTDFWIDNFAFKDVSI